MDKESESELLLGGILGVLREIAAHLKTLAEAAERAHPPKRDSKPDWEALGRD
jgi:hypothetical protein